MKPAPAAVLACLALLAAGLPAVTAEAQRAVPPGLPDLFVGPADLRFIDGNGTAVNETPVGDTLFINVTVHNAGPAASGPYRACFYENGALLETVQADPGVAAGGSSQVSLLWETYLSLVGPCEISVALACPAGDANFSNNTVARVIRLRPVAPVLDVTLERPVVEIGPAGGTGLLARLRGEVDLRMPFNQTAVVQLWPVLDNGWACAVLPAYLQFAYSGSPSFVVTIRVPGDAQGGSTANLTIRARATSEGYVVPGQATSRITVRPSYGVTIQCDRGYVEIKPGGTARFTLRVINTGNAVAGYNLTIGNLGYLVAWGWAVELDRTELAGMRPGEARTVNLTARSPDEFSLWTSMPSVFVVNVSTPAPDGTAQPPYRFPVYVYEKGASTWGEVVYYIFGIVAVCLVLFPILSARRTAAGRGKGPAGPS